MLRFSFDTSLISKYRTELMGLSILGVMCGHLMNYTIQPQFLGHFVRLLHTPAFLFLSGFGLYYSFSNDSNIVSFIKRRIIRLYIPYLIIGTPFFLSLLFSQLCNVSVFFGYISTIAFWINGNYYGMWYIAVSVILYALFPILYHFMFNNKGNPIFYLSITLSVMSFIFFSLNYLYPSYWRLLQEWLSKTYTFPIGCYLGYLSKKKYHISYFILCFIQLSFIVLFYLKINTSVMRTLASLPFICIFLSVLFKDNKFTKIRESLLWFGKHSLELYLLHVLIFKFFVVIIGMGDKWSMALGIFLGLILCHPISLAIKKYSKYLVPN